MWLRFFGRDFVYVDLVPQFQAALAIMDAAKYVFGRDFVYVCL